MKNGVLVIDDLRTFSNGREAMYARNSQEGLEQITHGPWDEVWLDHDLGENDTIRPVVTFLEEQFHAGTPIEIGQVFVHTGSPIGAQWMMAGLSRVYDTKRVDANLHGLTYDEALLGGQ